LNDLVGLLGDPGDLGKVVKDRGYFGGVLGEGYGKFDVAVGLSKSSLTVFVAHRLQQQLWVLLGWFVNNGCWLALFIFICPWR